jgi:hypothetical protein
MGSVLSWAAALGSQFSVLGSQLSVLSSEGLWLVAGADLEVRAFQFLLRSEDECTSERARGQFSIFGAVEEKTKIDFPESVRMK